MVSTSISKTAIITILLLALAIGLFIGSSHAYQNDHPFEDEPWLNVTTENGSQVGGLVEHGETLNVDSPKAWYLADVGCLGYRGAEEVKHTMKVKHVESDTTILSNTVGHSPHLETCPDEINEDANRNFSVDIDQEGQYKIIITAETFESGEGYTNKSQNPMVTHSFQVKEDVGEEYIGEGTNVLSGLWLVFRITANYIGLTVTCIGMILWMAGGNKYTSFGRWLVLGGILLVSLSQGFDILLRVIRYIAI